MAPSSRSHPRARFAAPLVGLLLVSLFGPDLTHQLRAMSSSGRVPALASIASLARALDRDPTPAGEAEKKISPQEASELFQAVSQILKFASRESGLPIRHAVKAKLKSREDVVSYLNKSMREDKGAQRVYRSELVLKKFGLLPRNYNLESAVVGMLREQIAGFYDPRKKTMNLLDWVPAEQQRAVLAHELTHALQDQSFGLDKWMGKGDIDLDKKKNLTPADMASDEGDEAREAVVEGQAETVMMNYILAGEGRTVLNSPEAIAALDADMLNGSSDSVEYKNAPIFLKDSLTFPYRYGLKFEVALLEHGGKAQAFTAPFSNVPRITRQIMQPETYLSGEHIEPLPLPDFRQILGGYERFDVGSIGEFDVSVLIEQYAGGEASRRLYPAWRGGYYYAVQPKKKKPSTALGLVYVSSWAEPKRALEFADIYAGGVAQRYQQARELTPPAGGADSDLPGGTPKRRLWQTEEGTVLIAVSGDLVAVCENLDPTAREQLERQIFTSPASP